MRNDKVPRLKTTPITMKAAKARVLRTSRLFLLPAIALSLTACTDNVVPDTVADIGRKADQVRESANAVFDPGAAQAQADGRRQEELVRDDYRDDRDGDDRDGRDRDDDGRGDDRDDRYGRDGDRDRHDDDDRRDRDDDRDDDDRRDRDGDRHDRDGRDDDRDDDDRGRRRDRDDGRDRDGDDDRR